MTNSAHCHLPCAAAIVRKVHSGGWLELCFLRKQHVLDWALNCLGMTCLLFPPMSKTKNKIRFLNSCSGQTSCVRNIFRCFRRLIDILRDLSVPVGAYQKVLRETRPQFPIRCYPTPYLPLVAIPSPWSCPPGLLR